MESLLQIVDFIFRDVNHGTQGQGVDDGVGGGFQNLQAVKGLQQVAAGSHSMAHYAFASGIMNLGFMIPGMLSGLVYQQVGFQWFFVIALLLSIPVFVLAKRVPFVNSSKADEE